MPKKQTLHAIDPLDLRIRMLRSNITLKMIQKEIKPSVSFQAIHKALHGRSKPLLPKIELVIKKLSGAKR